MKQIIRPSYSHLTSRLYKPNRQICGAFSLYNSESQTVFLCPSHLLCSWPLETYKMTLHLVSQLVYSSFSNLFLKLTINIFELILFHFYYILNKARIEKMIWSGFYVCILNYYCYCAIFILTFIMSFQLSVLMNFIRCHVTNDFQTT